MGIELIAYAALTAAAATVASTAYTLSQGSPDLPEVTPPPPPPKPPPPPPQEVAPPPQETDASEAVARERRKRAARFGVEQTLLTSPLGNPTPPASGVSTRSLLGGG